MRELKRLLARNRSTQLPCRTPPGVRELKLAYVEANRKGLPRRTPPGVRELKHGIYSISVSSHCVAPLPGCVN